jgi:sec-independent protein translocase protein TatB
MFNVGGGEVLVILIAALIVLGPDKLPNAARQVGKYLAEFRKISQGFQDELKSAMDITAVPDPEPVAYPPAEPAGAEPGAATATATADTADAGGPASEATSPDGATTEAAADAVAPEPSAYEMPATMTPTTRPEATPAADPGGDAPPIRDVGPTGPTAA